MKRSAIKRTVGLARTSSPPVSGPCNTCGFSRRDHDLADLRPYGCCKDFRASVFVPLPTPPIPFRPVRFIARHPARNFRCRRCRHRKAASHHHWLPQQDIRVYVRGLRLGETERRRLLRRLLRDERNISPMCQDCHGAAEGRSKPFTCREVPASAFEFAAELGAEWRAKLDHLYPTDP